MHHSHFSALTIAKNSTTSQTINATEGINAFKTNVFILSTENKILYNKAWQQIKAQIIKQNMQRFSIFNR